MQKTSAHRGRRTSPNFGEWIHVVQHPGTESHRLEASARLRSVTFGFSCDRKYYLVSRSAASRVVLSDTGNALWKRSDTMSVFRGADSLWRSCRAARLSIVRKMRSNFCSAVFFCASPPRLYESNRVSSSLSDVT